MDMNVHVSDSYSGTDLLFDLSLFCQVGNPNASLKHGFSFERMLRAVGGGF
jgi:hypothetical protein